jgi:hypothetical protein
MANVGVNLRMLRIIMDEFARNERKDLLAKYQQDFDKYMQALR